MIRLLMLVVGFPLTILSHVHAEGDLDRRYLDRRYHDEIRSYAFSVDQCVGAPEGGNIDLQVGECYNFPRAVGSIKAFWNGDYDKWIEDVNNGVKKCSLFGYDSLDCNSERFRVKHLPGDFQECLNSRSGSQFLSARFDCEDVPKRDYSTTIYSTSYSRGSDDVFTRKATETTIALIPTADCDMIAARRLAVNSGNYNHTDLDQRHKHESEPFDSIQVSMLHPWSKTPICYRCSTEEAYDFADFSCTYYRKEHDRCESAKVNPNGSRVTSTTTVTVPSVVATVTTTLYALEMTPGGILPPLSIVQFEERKSWHTPVKFPHPYFPGKLVCADAEWEKRGKPDEEIRLQHVKLDLEDCEGNEADLALADPATKTYTQIISQTVTETTVSSATALVGVPAAPLATTTLVPKNSKHGDL